MPSDINITLAFSSCPNDTFIFDAIVNKKIDTSGFKFNIVIKDIEVLNKMAVNGEADMVKVSFAAYSDLFKEYCVLSSGAALGMNCGPLIIAKNPVNLSKLTQMKLAIPGEKTTAHRLLNLFFPEISQKTEMLFSDIEEAVLNGDVDAGLIIHESRFTYHEKGLVKLADLGELWHKKYHLPLPLGGIVAKRKFDLNTIIAINKLMYESVLFAMKNRKSALPYVKKYAVDMNEDVMLNHIDLYVNRFTIDINDIGRKAVRFLNEGRIPENYPIFVDESVR